MISSRSPLQRVESRVSLIPDSCGARWLNNRFVTRTLALVLFGALGAQWATIPAQAAPPVVMVPGIPVQLSMGASSTYVISATNTPTFYTASNLPAGMTLNRTTGQISGRPRLPGVYRTKVAAANADGTSFAPGGGDGTQEVVFNVTASATTPVAPVV